MSKVLYLCLATCYLHPPAEIIIIVNLYQSLSCFLKIFLLLVFIPTDTTFLFCLPLKFTLNGTLFLYFFDGTFCFPGQHHEHKIPSCHWKKNIDLFPLWYKILLHKYITIHWPMLLLMDMLSISNGYVVYLCIYFDEYLVNMWGTYPTVELLANRTDICKHCQTNFQSRGNEFMW